MPVAGRLAQGRTLRPEIQGLRAVAVALVVFYHLGFTWFSGGYVGVDVFFVISGFLITSHIASRVEDQGHLQLANFWVRRARRLLPASFLVLAISLVLTWLVLPRILWQQTLRQIVASTLYVQNWVLAQDAVDYSALGDIPTLVQHYWSLSVEEQFYVIWPVLLVLALWMVRRVVSWRRTTRVKPRSVLLAVILLVTVSSLIWSVLATNADPSRAYFDTGTRMWEFGAGGLLALAPRAAPRVQRLAPLVGWVGLGLISVAAITYSNTTNFPGYLAAVPVLGTALVIGCGGLGSGWSPDRILSWHLSVFIGDISYAVYLWHWPLIVCWPYLTRTEVDWRAAVVILPVTILLAWASTKWFEEPLRFGNFLAGGARTALVSLVAMVLIAGIALSWGSRHEASVKKQRAFAAKVMPGDVPCLGPATLAPDSGCELGDSLDSLLAPLEAVISENTKKVFSGCAAERGESEILSCTLGYPGRLVRTVVIVGDSHATHWFSALDTWGAKHRWRIITYTRASCPFTTAQRIAPGDRTQKYEECAAANRVVLKRILENRNISAVITSSFASSYGWKDASGRTGQAALNAGVRDVAGRLARAGKPLVVIRDVPLTRDGQNVPDCLTRLGSVAACSLLREKAVVPDPYAESAALFGMPVVDLTDWFCTSIECPVVVGNVVVYRDPDHLTADYSRLLADVLGEKLQTVLDQQ